MPPRVVLSEEGFWANLKSFMPILLPILIPMFGLMIWFIKDNANTNNSINSLILNQARLEVSIATIQAKTQVEHDSMMELKSSIALLESADKKITDDLTQGYARGQKRDSDVQAVQADNVGVKQILANIQNSMTQVINKVDQLDSRLNDAMENFYRSNNTQDKDGK